MSGPNPPGPDSPGPDGPERGPGKQPARDVTGETDIHAQAYSAPESEQFTSGPYVPADPGLYDYDSYDEAGTDDQPSPPRWPWVVGIAAIVAAVALVVSVGLLVTSTNTSHLATPATSTTTSAPPFQDEITTTTPPPPPPEPPPPTTEEPPPPPPETVTVTTEPPPATTEAPPPVTTTTVPPVTTTTTPAGPRQVTYSVTGSKSPGDIITITYTDASGRSRVIRNVYIPWSLTVTPISQSEVGSVQADSLFQFSKLNCQIITSDGITLSADANGSAHARC
jgi:hypothetical protein